MALATAFRTLLNVKTRTVDNIANVANPVRGSSSSAAATDAARKRAPFKDTQRARNEALVKPGDITGIVLLVCDMMHMQYEARGRVQHMHHIAH